MNDPVLTSHETLWKNPALKIYYEESFAMLEAIARRQAENQDGDAPSEPGVGAKRRKSIEAVQISIMGMFTPFENEAKAYLAGEPWQAFLESDAFTRYAQWKQLELNMKVNELDFDIHRILGRGGFGEVYGCRKRDTGAMFAMKQLDKKRLKKEGQEMSVIHERNVLAEMTSKFVTNLKYAFHDKDTLYLVMDLMEGGDLAFHLKQCESGRFTEAQARFYGAEISLGLAHLHSHSFIYRDLKPANVLLSSSGHARISDMGLVRDCSKTWPSAQCGTHGYMAPEVLLDNTSYGLAADWFSLGCTIYELLVGVTPFYGKSKKKGKR
jgi:beta-adrenergic-receptor kinase